MLKPHSIICFEDPMTSWLRKNNLTILSQVQWPEMHGKHIAWWFAVVWRALSRRMGFAVLDTTDHTTPHEKPHEKKQVAWISLTWNSWSLQILQINHPQKRGHTGLTGHENCSRQCPPGIPIKEVMTDAMFTLIGWGIVWPLDSSEFSTAWVWTTQRNFMRRTYDSYDSSIHIDSIDFF